MQNAECRMQNAEFMVIVGTGVLDCPKEPYFNERLFGLDRQRNETKGIVVT